MCLWTLNHFWPPQTSTATSSEPAAEQIQALPPLSPDGANYHLHCKRMFASPFLVPNLTPPPPQGQAAASSTPMGASPTPPPAGGNVPAGPNMAPELLTFLQAAIQKGVQVELQRRTSSWVAGSACSNVDLEGSLLEEGQVSPGVSAPSVAPSAHPSYADEDAWEGDLSDDEDLAPDQPSFVGLFKPQLFRSLLHKVKLTTRLGTTPVPSIPSGDTGVSLPL